MKKYKKLFIIGGLVVLAGLAIWIFGFVLPDNEHKKNLEDQLAQTNEQIGHTRLTPDETKKLLVKRKALLQELIKLS